MRTTRGAPDGARGSRPPPFHRGARAGGPADPWPPPMPSPRARGAPRGMRDDRVVSRPRRYERRRSREAVRVPRASEPRTQGFPETERAVLGGNPFLLFGLDRVQILTGSEPIDVQGAVQVVGLVKHALGPEFFADEREALSGEIIRDEARRDRALEQPVHAPHRGAAV